MIVFAEDEEPVEPDQPTTAAGANGAGDAPTAEDDNVMPSTSNGGPGIGRGSTQKKKPDGSGDGPPPEAADVNEAGATEKKTVRSKRGYLHYPAYLFDVPPSNLNIEHLRRKFIIAEIERSSAEKMFYTRAVRFMSFMTESVRSFAASNGFQLPGSSQKENGNDHVYSMQVNDSGDEEIVPSDTE